MSGGKKRVWSEDEFDKLFEKHAAEIFGFNQRVRMWMLTGGSLVDFAPRISLFYRSMTAGGGEIERTFVLHILFMSGVMFGRDLTEAIGSIGGGDDNGDDSGSSGGNGTGTKN